MRRRRRFLHNPTKNKLLDSLPADLLSMMLARLEPVDLPVQTFLFRADSEPRYVHFLTSGIASVVVIMESGETMEVNMIGREGIPERLHLLDHRDVNIECSMQLGGDALRMPLQQFRDLFLREPNLLTRVLSYVQEESLVVAQLSACNRLHELESRLARWLLMVSDRVGATEFILTQEFLAQMLGTRRSTVNLAAGTLQRTGVISFSRGRIRIHDVEALQGVACECYPVIAKLFRSLYA